MGKTIAILGIGISGIYLLFRIRHLLGSKGKKINFMRNSVDLFLSIGIFVLSILQLREEMMASSTGIPPKSYVWYIIGGVIIYFIWAKINVNRYRKNIKSR